MVVTADSSDLGLLPSIECKCCDIKDPYPYINLRNGKCDGIGVNNHSIFPKLPTWGLYNGDNVMFPRSEYYGIVDIEEVPKTMNGFYIANNEGYVLRMVNNSDMDFVKGNSYLFRNPNFGSKVIIGDGNIKRVPVALITQESLIDIFDLDVITRKDFVAALLVQIIDYHHSGKTCQESFSQLSLTQGSMPNATCEHCLKDVVYKSVCSTCKCVLYCNRECQIADWKRHKQNCVAIQLIQKLFYWIQLRDCALEFMA